MPTSTSNALHYGAKGTTDTRYEANAAPAVEQENETHQAPQENEAHTQSTGDGAFSNIKDEMVNGGKSNRTT